MMQSGRDGNAGSGDETGLGELEEDEEGLGIS
jgi:hypothetical protein